MLRSMTYAVRRGTTSLRGSVNGQPSASLAQIMNTDNCLHTSVTGAASQTAPEQDTSKTCPTINTSERFSDNDVVSPNFVNRNPRNLERMAVARKDKGWSQSRTRRDYWHKLHFEKSNRHIKAYVQHYDGSIVVSVSTKEWAVKRYMYSTADVSAAENIGRVLAQRCLESGISYLHWNIELETRQFERMMAFIKAMKDGGMILNEPKSITDFRKPINYFPGDE